MNFFLAIILAKFYKTLKNKSISSAIELGAGSGRASRYLNFMGAQTGILDLSKEAIAYCRYINKGVPQPVEYYHCDIFNIKYNKKMKKPFFPKSNKYLLTI